MKEHIPWRGSRYQIGINQEGIAILGYSHWFSENEEDSDELTIRVMSKVITGEYSDIPFFNHIRDYFGFESNKEFWNRVLFFNYLPDAIGIADERFKTGSVGQIERA